MHAGDDAGDFSLGNDGRGDHGIGFDVELLIEGGAVLRIGEDMVLTKRLAGGVDHADDAFAERVGVVGDKVFCMRSVAEHRDEMITACEPEGAVFTSDDVAGSFQHLDEEGAGGVINFWWHGGRCRGGLSVRAEHIGEGMHGMLVGEDFA